MNQRLRRLRELNSYSQKYIAELLGISQSAYSQIEKGSVALSIEHLKTLCRKYQVSLDWMAWGERSMAGGDQGTSIPIVNISKFHDYVHNLNDDAFLRGLPQCHLPDYDSSDFIAFEIPGEGLKPHIYPHDYVICKRVDQMGLLSSGSFVVKITAKRLEVIRLQRSIELEEADLIKNAKELWKVETRLSRILTSASEDQEQRLTLLEREFGEVKNQLQEALGQTNFRG